MRSSSLNASNCSSLSDLKPPVFLLYFLCTHVMSSAPKTTVKFIILAVILLLVRCEAIQAGTRASLMCYACMSRNIPNVTRTQLSRTVNTPAFAQDNDCNDPFSFFGAVKNDGVRFEPCSTACVKVVSQNRYIHIVLRGCQSTLYATQMEGLPRIMIPGVAQTNVSHELTTSCDVETEMHASIGEIFTTTCMCYDNFCNSADVTSCSILFVLILSIAFTAASYH
uniref:Uncharacterized protein n=1 Tax=Plectus sambesii TaxID=2011161 RepID=A0A914UR52_9BILA